VIAKLVSVPTVVVVLSVRLLAVGVDVVDDQEPLLRM
jgi:hypothetical protein